MNMSRRQSLFSVLFLMILLGLWGGEWFAPDLILAAPVEMTIDGVPPWKVAADALSADRRAQVYTATGHVMMIRGTETITGDVLRYQAETQTAEIRGNVIMTTADFKATCQRIVVNLAQNIGKMYEGKVFFPTNHYYISGDEIEKTGPDTFRLIRGRATSCDGPQPAWTFSGYNIVIEKEGYATAEHATFNNRYFPMLYLPWLKVPVKARRQSGLLVPGISNSSRDGFTYSQPFYWAVSDSKDLTFYLTYMGNRGLEPTLEATYNDWGGKGLYRISYLQDQTPPSIYMPRSGRYREQDERYWLRGMSDMKTANRFNLKLDVDFASDPRYLDEFSGSFTGYNASRLAFLNEFGRELAEPLDPLRKSTFQATKAINSQNLRLALEYTDNLRDPDNLETIQRLPRIGLDVTRLDLARTPLYFSSSSEYTYFTRRTNSQSTLTEEGHRLDIHPRFHWPMVLSGFLNLEPSVGLRETLYFPFGMNYNPAYPTKVDRNYRFYRRELFDFTVEASTNLSRVYNLDWGPVEKIKHRLKPEVTFSLVPSRSQGELPYWDSVDRIEERRRLRYGLVNYLVGKVKRDPHQNPLFRVSPQTGGDQREESGPEDLPRDEYEYREFFRLGLHRAYDYIETEKSVIGRSPLWPQDVGQGHSPWEIEMEFEFWPWVRTQLVSAYDTYNEMFVDHVFSVDVTDRRGDSLTLEYDLHREPDRPALQNKYEYEEIRGSVNVALNEEWSVGYQRRYSLQRDRNLETSYMLSYFPQCWGTRLIYSEKPDDKSIAIVISLLGLGEVGSYSYRTESRPSPTPKTLESPVY